MARFVLSAHALQQLKERNLSRRMVLTACQNPDTREAESLSRFRYLKQVMVRNKPYLLVVIVDHANRHKEIVTAFLTSKIHKYL